MFFLFCSQIYRDISLDFVNVFVLFDLDFIVGSCISVYTFLHYLVYLHSIQYLHWNYKLYVHRIDLPVNPRSSLLSIVQYKTQLTFLLLFKKYKACLNIKKEFFISFFFFRKMIISLLFLFFIS